MSPFPPKLPEDLDRADLIAANDWQAFSQVTEFVNHWDRPGWHDGRTSYHWMFTFDDPALQEMAQQCQKALANFPFDPVPLDTLHITMRRVGFTDEITESTANEVFDAAQEICAGIEPFRLNVGPLAGSRGAVRFTVSPWSQLFAVYDALGKASEAVTAQPAPTAAESFRPHLSVAYSNTPQPAAPIHGAIRPYRLVLPVPVPVAAIHLVQLGRSHGAYRWMHLRHISLDN
jgi:2'-5' RNA ligase